MIAVLKASATERQRENLIRWLNDQNVQVHISEGSEYTVLGLVGDTAHIDMELLESLDIIESVKRVSEPFKKVNRKFHPADTVIDAGGVPIGGGHFAVIAGPCCSESRERMLGLAEAVRARGAKLLRGGALKLSASPYETEDRHVDGLALLKEAKRASGLPIVAELSDPDDLERAEDVDVVQVGARNMQNYELLRALSRTDKTVLLKRGAAASIQELLMSAEHIMAGGNDRVILCERGIRTFEPYTRNTLDLSAVPVLHKLTHLPVIVDPSHATGHAELVPAMALAAAACGADGLMIEVHDDPLHAVSDGAQSLTPEQFGALMRQLERVREAVSQ